jgi:hypothetical protein
MTIKTKKEVEVEIEIDLSTPKFFKKQNDFIMASEENIITVSKNAILGCNRESVLESYFRSCVTEAITDGVEITEEEFNEKYLSTREYFDTIAGISNVPTLQLQEA